VAASGLELSDSEGSNKITYENGSVYIGMVIKDKIRHGFGNYQWTDGSKYEGIPEIPKTHIGYWENDQACGFGK
jgi:hypothetical protein